MTAVLFLNTPEEEAERLKTTAATLAKARSTGSPKIPYIKIGKSVRYDPVAVDAYLAQHTVNKIEAGA